MDTLLDLMRVRAIEIMLKRAKERENRQYFTGVTEEDKVYYQERWKRISRNIKATGAKLSKEEAKYLKERYKKPY